MLADTLSASDEIRLVATRSAVTCAGLFVVSTLMRWGARPVLMDAVSATEQLVTSAITATGMLKEIPRWTEIDHLNLITVRLPGRATSVVIEVEDCDPDMRTQPALAGSVVHRGSYPTGGGKVVWAELTIPAGRCGARPRPYPQPLDERAGQIQPPDLLRRVRDGLKDINSRDLESGHHRSA